MPIGLAAVGAAWSFAADRISARWPAHEDGYQRAIGWRSVVTVLVGTLAGYLLAPFASDVPTLAFLGAYIVVLVVLLATDLDQRLLPDVLTLPLIPYALLGAWLGWSPYVSFDSGFVLDVVAAVGLPLGFFALSIPFGRGAIGIGDLKFLVGAALVAGAERAVLGVVAGALLSAVVIVVLIAARRITLHSYVPYGPFLIIGILWALLGPAMRGA